MNHLAITNVNTYMATPADQIAGLLLSVRHCCPAAALVI